MCQLFLKVSFTFPHKDFKKSEYIVRFFDERSITQLIRLLRDGSQSDVKPLFTVPVKHKVRFICFYFKGVWQKPTLHTETTFLIIILLITLGAVYTKNKSF